jgi:acyl CoA:acetate/3-ketoacid CoA transferase alpha subunit
MAVDYSQITRITVSSEYIGKVPEQLIARIKEHNQKDLEAIARGKEERKKWLLKKNKREQKPS